MSRLIDADAKTFPTKYRYNNTKYAEGWNACLSSIAQQPTVDAVPVVRCGECKRGMEYEFGIGYVHFACCDIEEDGTAAFAQAVDENGFCYRGERMEDNGT